jgi:hypothetical protein
MSIVRRHGWWKVSLGVSRPHALAVLAALLAGGSSGCGSADGPAVVKVYAVTGKVLLADGEPLTGGRIWLVPAGDSLMSSSGEIGGDGTFTVATGPSGEGAPAGEYKVRIEPSAPVRASRSHGGRVDPRTRPFPEKYLDEDSSQVRVTVRPDVNQWDAIRLK